MAQMWMVRAERGGRLYDDFREKSAVAIGWPSVGSLENLRTREQIAERVAQEWPDAHPQWQSMAVGQLHRFRSEIEVGDRVVTYDPSRRVYLVGTISGPYRFDETIAKEDPNLRPVEWQGEISRDLLAHATRNAAASEVSFQSDPQLPEADLAPPDA